MTETSRLVLRIPSEDHEWLKAFVALYPKDSLNSMMARFIRERITELVAEAEVEVPPYSPERSPLADL